MPVQWVKQEHPNGCGFAVLAMLVGRTYAEIIAEFNGDAYSNGYRYDPEKSSPGWQEMDRYLAQQGYAVARIFQDKFPHCLNEQYEWPPAPLVDVNLCNVTVNQDSSRNHWIVLLGDRSVLDPLTDEARTITDYHKINSIAAVVRFERKE